MGRTLTQRALDTPDAVGDGRRIKQEVVATFDFAVDGGAVGDIGLGVSIPANAVIWDGYVDVLTTFTSPTADTATVGLEAGTDDLVTAVAIGTGTPWDAGLRAMIPLGAIATAVKVGTAAVELILDIGVEDITAGKAIFVVEYSITGA